MKRFLFGGAALAMASLLAAAPDFGSAQSAPAWTTFHANMTRNGATTAPGPLTNTATNTWQLPKAIESSPAVDSNGVGYVGDDDGNVYALDPAQKFDPTKPNKTKWAFKTNGPVLSSPTLSQDGSTLYVGSNDNNVYALKTSTGDKIWSANVGGEVHASPLLSGDGATLYIANVNGEVVALKTSDGTVAWGPYNIGNSAAIPGSLALSPDGSTLYIATYTGFMYAIPATGTQAGKTVSTTFYLDGGAVSTPAIDANGNIYVSTTKGSLISFAPGSAQPRWTYAIPSHLPALSTPAIANGLVIFGDSDQNLYAVSASTGQLSWQAHTGGAIGSSPAIAGNSMVYVGSDDGNIYAFNTSGPLVWNKGTGSAVSSSPAVGPDGTLWAGSQTGVMYRIGVINPPGTPQVAATGTATPTSTPGPTSTPAPTATPSATATSTGPNQPVVTLSKSQVKPGQKISMTIKTSPNTRVHIRIDYPNGDHQSHGATTNASGTVTYSYKQGASKIMHNKFTAKVTVKAGDAANAPSATGSYKILFGNLDTTAEPRQQSVGRIVNIYVHTGVGKRVSAYLSFPTGKFVTLNGRTGPHGFAHFRYKVPARSTAGKNHKVKVVGKLRTGPGYSSATSFTIK